MQLNLEVIRQDKDQDDLKYDWDEVTFHLTPKNIPEYIENPKGTLICTACHSGQEPWVKAFLAAGYKAYIAPVEPVHVASSVLFITSFFYHLLMHTREYTDRVYTPQQAVEAAAQADTHYEYGTRLFQYFGNQ